MEFGSLPWPCPGVVRLVRWADRGRGQSGEIRLGASWGPMESQWRESHELILFEEYHCGWCVGTVMKGQNVELGGDSAGCCSNPDGKWSPSQKL